MAQPRQIIQFLRACYEADNRQTAVANLFNKSIRHLQFIEGEERLLSGLLPRIPLATEAAPTAMKAPARMASAIVSAMESFAFVTPVSRTRRAISSGE